MSKNQKLTEMIRVKKIDPMYREIQYLTGMKAIKLLILFIFIHQTCLSQSKCTLEYKIEDIIDEPHKLHHEGTMSYKSTGWVPDIRFTDDFNVGPYPDPNMWNNLPQGKCNNLSDMAYFKNTNCTISDGKLHLICQPDEEDECNGRKLNNSSGWIGTQQRARYGYFEIECVMPTFLIVQPCFWLFGEEGENPTPNFTSPTPYLYDEIDVNECITEDWHINRIYRNNLYHHQYFFGYNHIYENGYLLTIPYESELRGRTIVFAVEWFPYEVNFYIDGDVHTSFRFTDDEGKVSPINWPWGSPSEYVCTLFQNAIGQWIQLSFALREHTDRTLTYDIEYLHAYKLVDGGDDFYWPDFLHLKDPTLSQVHSSIKIGGDNKHLGRIPSDSHINLWATDNILLDKGFECSSESSFTARVIKVSDDCFLPNGLIEK